MHFVLDLHASVHLCTFLRSVYGEYVHMYVCRGMACECVVGLRGQSGLGSVPDEG